MRTDIGQWKHFRGGKFGKVEQNFEMEVSGYLDTIKTGALGYYRKVADFTTRKSGLLDTEKVKKIAESMVSSPGDYSFKDEGEKQFYYSFIYCALVLCSLEFQYVCPDCPEQLSFYTFKKTDFKELLKNADMLQSEEAGKGPVIGLEQMGMYDRGFTALYALFSGREMEFDGVWEEPLKWTDREFKEEMDDMKDEWENVENDEVPPDYYDEDDGEVSEEWVREENEIAAGKLKAIYPGYKDFVSNLERFKDLYHEYAALNFFEVVKDMVGQFLVEGGYSLYNNESALISVLIQLKKASNIVKRSLYGATDSTDSAESGHGNRI